MTRSNVSNWRLLSRAVHTAILALTLLCGAACGLQAHPGSLGSGGQTKGTGGQGGSGGVEATGTGGQSGGSGGQSTETGGQGDGSGGQETGGQTGDSGGQGSGGRSPGNGGAAGKTAGSGGATSSGGRTAGSGGTSSAPSTGGSGGGGSGAGVILNGKFVPKEKAVVFIHFGHSNMRGQATKPTGLKPYFYETEDGLWSYRASNFALAKEPTAPEGSQTYAGPGMAILHSARGAVGAGSDVQFISIGYGVGSKTSVDFEKSGSYYPLFMGWAGQLKGNVTFGAIVVMLGITERHLAADQIPGFPSRMAQIISDMRADLGEPNLPVLFCDYEQGATGDLAPTGSVGSVLQPLVRQIPKLVSNLVLVPTDNLEMQDDHHFDMQGHKDWAARVIQLMQSNNWFPWK